MILMTPDGTFLDANAAALELYGYSRSEMLALHLSDIQAAKDREHIPEEFRGPHGQARQFEADHLRRDGSCFPVEVRAVEVPNGDATLVLCTLRDITQRRYDEATWRRSQARFDNIAATIPGVLYEYAVNPEGGGSYVYVGPGCFELLGIDEKQMLTGIDPLWELVHPDDIARVLAEDEAAEGVDATFSTDFRLVTPAGELKWIHMASRQLPSRAGAHDVWCGFMLDVTERKVAEERLLKRDQEMARLNAELARAAGSDALTGLASRRHFYDVLDREIATIDQHDGLLCVVSFDLDGLKRVNDSLGHGAGDEMLTVFAGILDSQSHVGTAGRLGGDEFSVILPGAGVDAGVALAERVIVAVRDCASLAYASVTVSGGVAQWSPFDESDDLLRRADVALYASKRGGGNTVNR